MKILFTGGGTLGPVTPLLAVVDAWKKQDSDLEVVWVGTPHGPERELVDQIGARFYALPVAKLPRYVSREWLTLPFKIVWAFACALRVLRKEKPALVGSAGGYTAVPVIFAAKLLRIPVWVHLQDVEMILTSKLTAPFANLVTAAWKENLKTFKKAKLVGNPVRAHVLEGSEDRARKLFNLDERKMTVFVFGGGSGATWMNKTMTKMGREIERFANVIHVTGKRKMTSELEQIGGNYNAVEFLADEMSDAYAAADLVVCRAGLATITELAALGKPAIVIPLPNSPQVKNACAIKEGAIVVSQDMTPWALMETIRLTLEDAAERRRMSDRIGELLDTEATDELIEDLKKL